MNIAYVGVGLIGGSFSLAIQELYGHWVMGGVSRKESTLDRAEELGLISERFSGWEAAVDWADWIILSIPVNAIQKMLPSLLDQVKDHQVVVDFGSTKGGICANVDDHPRRHQFIPAHPIAGTEYSGPEAAFSSLFKDKTMVICDPERVETKSLQAFVKVVNEIGMNISYLGAEEHDRHLAYISHLSHVTSFSLSHAVLQKERDGEVLLELAGSGFASTVRLAKSSPEMWAPIFLDNKKMLLESMETYHAHFTRLKSLLEADDLEGIISFLEKGREIRKILK
ncbi:MAG: prephenate dehydrogenase [Cyclobacteriaceae bacterium]|nr:prephenate dehydrogenase [Cyclobacteriaceae bacterium HetDA_MAG_MS6]